MKVPSWVPGRGVHVINGEIPDDVVPPSTSMAVGLNVTGKDKPPPPPPPAGKRCTCNRCPNCGGTR